MSTFDMSYDNNYESAISWQGDPYGYGDSPGMTATSPSGFTGAMTDGGVVGGPVQSAQRSANDPSLMGNPIHGMIGFLVFTLIIMLIVHRFGHADTDFANPKASLYSVGFISLVAVAGVPLWKILAAAYANANLPLGKAINTYVSAS